MIYLAFAVVFFLGVLVGFQAAKGRYRYRPHYAPGFQADERDLFELWHESWSIP